MGGDLAHLLMLYFDLRARISNPVSGGQCRLTHLTYHSQEVHLCAQKWPKARFTSFFYTHNIGIKISRK